MKKIKFEIKNRFTGKILFEYESENNTFRKTILEAISRNANLSYANLRNANLSYANLSYANLSYADIKRIKHLYQIIPEVGSFIAYKKLANECVAMIEIPSKSPRTCNLVNRKCRAKYVKTLKIWDRDKNEIKECVGERDRETIYKVNRLTHADKYDNDIKKDCTHGIHFFITKKEAENW